MFLVPPSLPSEVRPGFILPFAVRGVTYPSDVPLLCSRLTDMQLVQAPGVRGEQAAEERLLTGVTGLQAPGRRDLCDDCRELSEYGIAASGTCGSATLRLVERQSI